MKQAASVLGVLSHHHSSHVLLLGGFLSHEYPVVGCQAFGWLPGGRSSWALGRLWLAERRADRNGRPSPDPRVIGSILLSYRAIKQKLCRHSVGRQQGPWIGVLPIVWPSLAAPSSQYPTVSQSRAQLCPSTLNSLSERMRMDAGLDLQDKDVLTPLVRDYVNSRTPQLGSDVGCWVFCSPICCAKRVIITTFQAVCYLGRRRDQS
ncbi:hypothetical protein B0T17DRAFT_297533 [Bombardia bombarda]|uniref:Uncharacterized protein n=1 Tax=Bombardia bombarda TaxID=252184 RepID=A0AA40C1J4_9PEZI|nr:hypothetical protein B0T17DRAFT_297533 [Bombardia bombarda]